MGLAGTAGVNRDNISGPAVPLLPILGRECSCDATDGQVWRCIAFLAGAAPRTAGSALRRCFVVALDARDDSVDESRRSMRETGRRLRA